MEKKLLAIFALLFALAFSATAQPIFGKGQENRKISSENLASLPIVGEYNNRDVFFTEGKKHIKQVEAIDLNLIPFTRVPIPHSSEWEPLAVAIEGQKGAAMFVDRSSSKRTSVMGCSFDLVTGAAATPDTLFTVPHGRRDECLVWAATSPDGTTMAFIAIIQYNDRHEYQTFVALYDSELARLWVRDCPLDAMHEMLLTDEGRIVTLGLQSEGNDARFVFNVISKTRCETMYATLKCDPIKEIHLANLVGSRAIALGLYQPSQGRNADRYTQGIFGLSFDVDSAVLHGFTMRPFQNEDINILLNKHTKKMQRDLHCDHVELLDYTPVSYGAAMAVGRILNVEKTTNAGAVKHERYALGAHIAVVDTLGNFKWVRNIRRNEKAAKNIELVSLSIVPEGDRVCVVKSENAKEPLIYDISKEGREYKIGDKGNLVVYAINPEGDVEKILIERKTEQSHLRSKLHRDGKLAIYTGSNNRTRMAELSFDKPSFEF